MKASAISSGNRVNQMGTPAKRKHVCVVTSSHPPLDQRIYFRNVIALLDAGYEVSYIAPATTEKLDERLRYYSVPVKAYGEMPRLARYFHRTLKLPYIRRLATAIQADYYHMHDTDLISVALHLKRQIPECKVFYDIHEYYSRVFSNSLGLIGDKLARCWIAYERSACLKLDHTFVAVQGIATELELPQGICTVIHNYPDPRLFVQDIVGKPKELGLGAYVGTISKDRGADYLLQLANDYSLPVRLVVVGRFLSAKQREEYEQSFRNHPRIEFHENVNHNRLPKLLSDAQFALSLLDESLEGLPTKLIEYMALQCPIITTECGLSKAIVEEANCGMVVSRSYSSIRAAVETLINNPEVGYIAGENGRLQFERSLNWQNEAQKMLAVYSSYAEGDPQAC